jgi:hypothetical protein
MVLTKPYRKEALARRLREIMLVGSLSPTSREASGAITDAKSGIPDC